MKQNLNNQLARPPVTSLTLVVLNYSSRDEAARPILSGEHVQLARDIMHEALLAKPRVPHMSELMNAIGRQGLQPGPSMDAEPLRLMIDAASMLLATITNQLRSRERDVAGLILVFYRILEHLLVEDDEYRALVSTWRDQLTAASGYAESARVPCRLDEGQIGTVLIMAMESGLRDALAGRPPMLINESNAQFRITAIGGEQLMVDEGGIAIISATAGTATTFISWTGFEFRVAELWISYVDRGSNDRRIRFTDDSEGVNRDFFIRFINKFGDQYVASESAVGDRLASTLAELRAPLGR